MIATLMTEGHQPYSEIMRMPPHRARELAAGIIAIIIARNRLVKKTDDPPQAPHPE